MSKDLYALDIYDFLEPKWAGVTRFGAGAIGIITPNQMISVLNIGRGTGEHADTRNIVLDYIFDFTKDFVSGETKNEILDSIVTLRFFNSKFGNHYIRHVAIEIPSKLSGYQYETLCCISSEFDDLVDFGLEVSVFMGNDNELGECPNQLRLALPILASRVCDDVNSIRERLVSFDSSSMLVTDDIVLKK